MKPVGIRRLCAFLVASSCVASTATAQTFPPDSSYQVITCNNMISFDPVRDEPGAQTERDIVGNDMFPALYTYNDGTFLFLRMRLGGSPLTNNMTLTPFGWGFELDNDGDYNDYEYLILADGITSPEKLYLLRNDVQQNVGDPSDVAETILNEYLASTHTQATVTTSMLGGDPDYLFTVAIPVADLQAAGVLAGATVVWAGTSSNARSLASDIACHDGRSGDPVLGDIGPAGIVVDPNKDSDGDGVKDSVEQPNGVNQDTDMDGTPDHLDTDDDGDGVPTSTERPGGVSVNTDGTDRPNYLDPDDDNDGILTRTENTAPQGTNVDGDMRPNYLDTDSDADGKLDSVEGTGDVDGDGRPNYLDPDDSDGPSADPDNDGLTNGQEGTLGTNPRVADTDGDGLNDGNEVMGGTPGVYNPGVDTNPLDADTDDGGVNDGDEVMAGKNPLNPADDGTVDQDPDNDGLTNSEEAALGTNPNRRDTDGDGLSDGEEVAGGSGRATYEPGVDTNPLDADTDDGGVNDGVEVGRGSNPLDPSDDNPSSSSSSSGGSGSSSGGASSSGGGSSSGGSGSASSSGGGSGSASSGGGASSSGGSGAASSSSGGSSGSMSGASGGSSSVGRVFKDENGDGFDDETATLSGGCSGCTGSSTDGSASAVVLLVGLALLRRRKCVLG